MSKKIALLFCGMLAFGNLAAQDSTRTNYKYFGIQSNQLLRQLLNFGNNTSNIENPYLLTYAINSTKDGIGFTTGLGYTYNQFNDGDALTPRKNLQSAFAVRLGIEKKVFWGKHWMVSYGADLLLGSEKEKTETNFNNGGIGQNVTSEVKRSRVGLGPRFTLNYLLTDRLIVGTEGSYYFKSTDEERAVTTQPRQNTKLKSFNVVTPSVIYLIFRF
jgi:hypothetical protein